LQGCLVRLRKELGAGAIETRPHRYCLVAPADEVDACQFEWLGGGVMVRGEAGPWLPGRGLPVPGVRQDGRWRSR
jgi:hypothetical protein